ncbi:hypothetical protein AMAG_13462 [Allomyces macrogynus ATCC 38327]|uniref:Uncharacterized protein n=1 Tax=Allomyces macrogynus (strain ATCC 38327) TaxID=578462 RepID=A0A0L0T1U8_ALLM3|nr:hypothetical protein AMAG_13462 [Allomyces macrogynus ATCC 38327]|eukprot:KNE68823.1 hypothetical protein AMAG_13462 [Allomyces macrogynus ATCC 38327]
MIPARTTRCTGPNHVQGCCAPTATAIDTKWLAAALGLPPVAITTVAANAFSGGFSPIVKSLLCVEYDATVPAEESSRPAALFMKLLPADTTNLVHRLGDAIVPMLQQAHRVEAAFYAHAMQFEQLRSIVPRAYHADCHQAILLADLSSFGFKPLSPWSVDLTEGPDVDRTALLAIVDTLATLHTSTGVIPAGSLLTWDALIQSRTDRVMIPVKHDAKALETLLHLFCAHFRPDAPVLLRNLCSRAAAVGYAAIVRAISTTSGIAHILHGDPNPGNVLYNAVDSRALLVDFQDTAADAPAVVDIARLLISAMHSRSRASLEAELVSTYVAKANIVHRDQFTRDLHLALLADAILIMASVAFTLETKAPALFYALGERSIACLRDHAAEMVEALQGL